MKNIFLIVLTVALLGALLPAAATVHVVTSTTDFADITRQIGNSRVHVESLATGDLDLHHVDPRPSFVTKLTNADVVVRIGMDLDLWMDSLLAASRNYKVHEGGIGYVDASAGIHRLEVPSGRVDPSMGDIHVYGNPHYWLDPENGKVIAGEILTALKRVDPAGSATYQAGYASFVAALNAHMARWTQEMAPLRGKYMVSYHDLYTYFYARFGLLAAGTMETKPGIPPSASHVAQLIEAMKRDHVKAVMTTAYYPTRYTDLVHRETGAAILVLPSSVNGARDSGDYFAMFDTIIAQLVAASR
jgi:ABC-type Zn uptake system ZnuABC Zn-binding protein ZnuA